MSRFVAGGSNEEPTERDEAWLKAQQEIEAKRQQQLKIGEREGGKSLYETLQANKAAKQEAFEESARLRNQFRSLDDDEVDFLDSVLEAERTKEAEVQKQTSEQLDAFKQRQQEAEKAANQENGSNAPETVEAWIAGPRKRKKGRESTIGGVKLRRTSTNERGSPTSATDTSSARKVPTEGSAVAEPKVQQDSKTVAKEQEIDTSTKAKNSVRASESPTPSTTNPGLGLVAYSSDEDD